MQPTIIVAVFNVNTKMSRSKKKPYLAWACYFSNKKDKTIANRIFRRKNKYRLKKGKPPLYHVREVSDTWNFESDGLAVYRGNDLAVFKERLGEEDGIKEFNKLTRK